MQARFHCPSRRRTVHQIRASGVVSRA